MVEDTLNDAVQEDEAREDTLLEFPCDFPIKAFGPAISEFPELVMEMVRCHAPDTPDEALVCKTSSGGRYFSVTVNVRATSRAQLDEIYRMLTASELVTMAL
ncbi:YbeD family protein [Acidihalobacter ferrooxydans]|uniref:UPF0250 protein BW247_14260 n=1 Tax=Acidihalobacter ferrooxydans TaxID=1765967 RepID=A0A1P8ULL7_9GAMM|nr:DUF493 domain-containing protein [Acidihalobacter ferrooxydans]APZ44729.1 hypothetical protein BW247_14260 [Acidihalobacter ferrooxydans]